MSAPSNRARTGESSGRSILIRPARGTRSSATAPPSPVTSDTPSLTHRRVLVRAISATPIMAEGLSSAELRILRVELNGTASDQLGPSCWDRERNVQMPHGTRYNAGERHDVTL